MTIKHLNYLLGLGVLTTVLLFVSTGLLPRAFLLVLAGAFLYLISRLTLKEGLSWLVLFLPWSFALPLSSQLDSLTLWRVASLILVIKWFTEYGFRGRDVLRALKSARLTLWLGLAWATWSVVGLLFTGAPLGTGLRQVALFVNALIFIPLIVSVFGNDRAGLKDFIKVGVIGALSALSLGLVQQIAVIFVAYFDFWQWWAFNIAPLFSGWATGELVAYSNTWFSYWPGDLATLRSFGTFPDSHSFAIEAILAGSLVVAVSKNFLPGLAFLMLMVGLSGTRGAWISVVILILFYFLAQVRTHLISTKTAALCKKSLILFFMGLIVSSLIWGAGLMAENTRLGRTGTLDILSLTRIRSIFDLDEVSNKGRLEIWRRSLAAVVKNPIFGVGLGNFPKAIDEPLTRARAGSSAHSLYLQYAVETGLIGLIIILAFYGSIIRQAWRLSRDSNNRFGRAAFIYMAWALCYSVVDVVVLNDRILVLFFIITGLSFAMPAVSLKFYAPTKV